MKESSWLKQQFDLSDHFFNSQYGIDLPWGDALRKVNAFLNEVFWVNYSDGLSNFKASLSGDEFLEKWQIGGPKVVVWPAILTELFSS